MFQITSQINAVYGIKQRDSSILYLPIANILLLLYLCWRRWYEIRRTLLNPLRRESAAHDERRGVEGDHDAAGAHPHAELVVVAHQQRHRRGLRRVVPLLEQRVFDLWNFFLFWGYGCIKYILKFSQNIIVSSKFYTFLEGTCNMLYTNNWFFFYLVQLLLIFLNSAA